MYMLKIIQINPFLYFQCILFYNFFINCYSYSMGQKLVDEADIDYVMYLSSMKNKRVFLWPLDCGASKRWQVCFSLTVHTNTPECRCKCCFLILQITLTNEVDYSLQFSQSSVGTFFLLMSYRMCLHSSMIPINESTLPDSSLPKFNLYPAQLPAQI